MIIEFCVKGIRAFFELAMRSWLNADSYLGSSDVLTVYCVLMYLRFFVSGEDYEFVIS